MAQSRLKQLNPSILTATGLLLYFSRAHDPPLRPDEDGDIATVTVGENEQATSQPNLESSVIGLETLLGGDPMKNGGDEATWLVDLSPLVSTMSKSSALALESETSI